MGAWRLTKARRVAIAKNSTDSREPELRVLGEVLSLDCIGFTKLDIPLRIVARLFASTEHGRTAMAEAMREAGFSCIDPLALLRDRDTHRERVTLEAMAEQLRAAGWTCCPPGSEVHLHAGAVVEAAWAIVKKAELHGDYCAVWTEHIANLESALQGLPSPPEPLPIAVKVLEDELRDLDHAAGVTQAFEHACGPTPPECAEISSAAYFEGARQCRIAISKLGG